MEGLKEGIVSEYGQAGENRLPARKKKKWTKEAVFALIVVLIPLIGYFFFNAFPLFVSIGMLFTDMKGYDLGTMQWNNFENFSIVFGDMRFYKSIGITLWLATAQLVTLSIALVISVLLTKIVKGRKILQILYFVPYITSGVATAIIWKWMFDGYHGLINGLIGREIHWLNNDNNPSTLTWAIYVSILWQAPGYGIVMFKSALDAVNPSLYEAADLDGAGAFRQFWYITVPSIAPTTLYLVFAGIMAGFGTFSQALLLAPVDWGQRAGFQDYGLTMMYYAYILGTQQAKMHLASVVSWVLFFMTVPLALFVMKKQTKKSKE